MHNGLYSIRSLPSYLDGRTVAVVRGRTAALFSILWLLRTGAPWADLPDRYPPYQTCRRRFQQWVRSVVLKRVFEALAADLQSRTRGIHRWQSCAGQKRRPKVGETKRGKRTKIMAVADSHGLPVGACIESASPHEVKLVESTLVQMVVPYAPHNLIGDAA
jgi:transposase